MRTDYKFWFIKRDDDGFITEVAVRFYEGDFVAEKYIRSKRLEVADLIHIPNIENRVTSEVSGKKAVLYTPFDFGLIKTDVELRLFLNKEISKDAVRVPIDGQKEAA